MMFWGSSLIEALVAESVTEVTVDWMLPEGRFDFCADWKVTEAEFEQSVDSCVGPV